MNKVPTITGSAQARLLLYRLLSLKLTETEEQLLSAETYLWENIIARLESLIDAQTQTASNEAVLKQAFSHIEHTTKKGLQRQIERLMGQSFWLGVFPSSLLESFVEEHQKLITSVHREYLDRIGMTIKRGIRDGRLEKEIYRDIRTITGISKRRARLIARCAPLQYSGALTRHHQMSASITHYRWQTSHDERVRESHRTREGRIFSWKSPGPYPRSEINCRCDAVPVLDL